MIIQKNSSMTNCISIWKSALKIKNIDFSPKVRLSPTLGCCKEKEGRPIWLISISRGQAKNNVRKSLFPFTVGSPLLKQMRWLHVSYLKQSKEGLYQNKTFHFNIRYCTPMNAVRLTEQIFANDTVLLTISWVFTPQTRRMPGLRKSAITKGIWSQMSFYRFSGLKSFIKSE